MWRDRIILNFEQTNNIVIIHIQSINWESNHHSVNRTQQHNRSINQLIERSIYSTCISQSSNQSSINQPHIKCLLLLLDLQRNRNCLDLFCCSSILSGHVFHRFVQQQQHDQHSWTYRVLGLASLPRTWLLKWSSLLDFPSLRYLVDAQFLARSSCVSW